jgi:hypothetical protein
LASSHDQLMDAPTVVVMEGSGSGD